MLRTSLSILLILIELLWTIIQIERNGRLCPPS